MKRQMISSGISKFIAGVINGAIALLIALLPERMKEHEPLSAYQSTAAHILSGIIECVLALVLFVYGYSQFAGGFAHSTSQAWAAGGAQNSMAEPEMRGLGVLGFFLYLLHPVSLLSFYVMAEGYVRAFAAGMTGRCHGIAASWVIYRIAVFARKTRRDALLRAQLGPYEPDSLFNDEASSALVLTSVENKDWRERQVAQYKDDFYILSARDFVRKGRYYRYQYILRRMLPGEIIRGRIAIIPSLLP
jgi:ribosomal protein S16